MRTGWGARGRFRRAAAALVALTLLPVVGLVATGHAPGSGSAPPLPRAALTAEDVNLPSVEAVQRSTASGLFAPFAWNGVAATGPFVTFGYSTRTGVIDGYSSLNGSSAELLVETIQVVGFSGGTSPQLLGPVFTAGGIGVTLTAHQEPMALLEIATSYGPRSVIFTFPAGTTALALSHATTWPRSTLSFSIGDSKGSIILWKGTMSVNGTAVTAVMESGDYLALRAVPAFADNLAQRTAILDAFASGRLAGEYDLVAMTNGNWLENAAEYRPNLTLSSEGVDFHNAVVTMNALASKAGIVLVAFDPRTMPADAGHRLVVTSNGVEIPEASDPLAALYAAPGPESLPSYSRLSMNATVLVIYLPSLMATSLEVQSLVLPPGGIDVATELSMVAAVFVVSVAAAAMFNTRRE